MSPTSQSTKRSITYVLIALLVLAAVYAIHASRVLDTFDKNYLIRTAFQTDLTPYISGEETTYSDGCLQFHDIEETHPLYIRYFSQPYERHFKLLFFTKNSARTKVETIFVSEGSMMNPMVMYQWWHMTPNFKHWCSDIPTVWAAETWRQSHGFTVILTNPLAASFNTKRDPTRFAATSFPAIQTLSSGLLEGTSMFASMPFGSSTSN